MTDDSGDESSCFWKKIFPNKPILIESSQQEESNDI